MTDFAGNPVTRIGVGSGFALYLVEAVPGYHEELLKIVQEVIE